MFHCLTRKQEKDSFLLFLVMIAKKENNFINNKKKKLQPQKTKTLGRRAQNPKIEKHFYLNVLTTFHKT